jgi:outer membrane receptor protein involved in Fe transport
VNYEVGLKGSWWDGALTSNLALYYMDWKNVQLEYLDDGLDEITNGGRAVSKGSELELKYAPIRNLVFDGSVAYTNAKLTNVSAGVSAATGAVAGDSLPFTPEWSSALTADYSFPINTRVAGSLGATFRYQGSKWSDFPADPYNTGVKVPSYDTVSLRAGTHWDRYKVQLRVDNLLNEHGIDTLVVQRIDTQNLPAWATIIQPRTLVLSLAAEF